MQNYANCINTDNTLLLRYIAHYMKNQTSRLNAKTVNANLHTNTSFSSSGYEIQGRRQPESSGAQFWCGEQEKRGPRGRQQGVVGEGAASLSPHQLGSLGERCKLPQRCPGRAPAAGSFSCILCHHIASVHLGILLQLCVELFMHMIATYFHGTRSVYSPCRRPR